MSAQPATFVGRRQLLDRLLGHFDSGSRVRADIITGVLGMGKSALLLHAERLAKSPDGTFDAIYVDLAPYGLGGSHDEQPTFGAAVEDYDLFSGFVAAVLTRLAPEGLARLETSRRAHQGRFREVKTQILNVYALHEVGDHSTVSSSGLTVNTNDTPRGAVDATYIQESRSWIEEERDILVEALNGRQADRPALLLLDNVDAVLERNFSTSLRVALNRLRGAVVVLAQEPGTKALLPSSATAIPVPPLREPEVRELLEAKLFGRPGQEELAPLVHQFSGGVPVAVEILIDLLNDEHAGMEVAELEERLRRLPQDPGSRLAEVVTTMEDHYQGRPLGVALRAASVPERCDATLLGNLLPVEGVPADGAPELLKDLGGLSVALESPEGEHYVEVHPFIRRGLLASMRKFRPGELGGYHEIVADHYYQKITDSDTYAEMFDFEDPTRQELTRQWLKHLGVSGDARISILQAARVFLDAMWWWGNYVEFDFCETLATDFEAQAEAASHESFADFARAVRLFLENYPFRATLRQDFEHSYPPAGWGIVQEQVLAVQELCGIIDMATQPTRLENHVKALTEIFMAHTYRYSSDPDRHEALVCYSRARECFRHVERWWDVPWMSFESADVSRESGEVSTAREGVAAAAKQLFDQLEPESPDEELIANLHRLLGDCSADENDVPGAAREYGLAVLHAFLFHRIGGPPDDYTMQFYFEIRGRALQWLIGLASRDDEVALAAALEMRRAVWGHAAKPFDEGAVMGALRDSRYADLALALFPRGPDVAELGMFSSAFMRELRRFRHRVGESSLRDLVETSLEPVPESG